MNSESFFICSESKIKPNQRFHEPSVTNWLQNTITKFLKLTKLNRNKNKQQQSDL